MPNIPATFRQENGATRAKQTREAGLQMGSGKKAEGFMEQDEAMTDFIVFYWVSQGDKRHALSERLCAKDKAGVVEMVMEKLNKRFFDFNSDTEGHVVVQSAHVQYVEIEMGSGAGCGSDDLPAGFVFPN